MTPNQLLDLLGIDFIYRPNRLAFHCPFHHDINPSAGFYEDSGLAHCFSCEYTLDMPAFYAKYKEMTRGEAERELEKEFGEEKSRRVIDRIKIAQTRNKAEQELVGARCLGRKKHALLGEVLDRILLDYERGKLDDERLDNLMEKWYNKVRENVTKAKSCSKT